MESKIVSVIIPTFNRQKVILNCILSIVNQTYDNIEIIVVDDGSTDDTKKEVESFFLKYDGNKKLKYITQKNKGASSARNYGLEVASGEYIIFFDSDDIMLSTRVEKQLKLIVETNSDCCAAGFKEAPSGWSYVPYYNVNDDLFGLVFSGKLLWSTQSWMFRKDLLNEVGGYDSSFTVYQDKEIIFRIFEKKKPKICIIKEELSIFINDPDDKNRIMKKYNSPAGLVSKYKFYKEVLEYLSLNTNVKLFGKIIYRFFSEVVLVCYAKNKYLKLTKVLFDDFNNSIKEYSFRNRLFVKSFFVFHYVYCRAKVFFFLKNI